MNKLGRILVLLIAASCSAALAQNYTGATPTFPGCGNPGCHNIPGRAEYSQWLNTRHAAAFDSASAIVQQTASCLECHTTGWDPTKANLGADDFVTVDTTKATFNVTVTNVGEFAKKTNVQCEACHGPTQFGVSHPPTTRITAETCGGCHQDAHHPYYEEWSLSAHSRTDVNDSPFLQGQFRTSPNCSGCHTAQGFIQFVGTTPADTANIIPNVAEPPGDNALPLACGGCHDPHDARHPGQLRLAAAQLCAKCHNPENAQPPDFPHNSTASMYDGVGAVELPGVTYRTKSIHQFVPPTSTEKCVACHVFTTPFDPGPPERAAATGHTFAPRLEACAQSGCHTGGLDNFNHRGRQTTIDSLLTALQTRLAGVSAADSATEDFQKALFNYRFVLSEGSRGVHNFVYAYDILDNTIEFFDGIFSSVEDRDTRPGLPRDFALYQNYPNPFNPTTVITFEIPHAAQVKLVMYDMLGHQVRTLLNERLAPRRYEITVNATDLPSGVYIYRLEAGDFTAMKKLVLMK